MESNKDNIFVKIFNDSFILNNNSTVNAPKLFGIIVFIFGLGMAFLSGYLYLNPETKILTLLSDSKGILICSIIYISFGLIILFSNKRQYHKNLEIKEIAKDKIEKNMKGNQDKSNCNY